MSRLSDAEIDERLGKAMAHVGLGPSVSGVTRRAALIALEEVRASRSSPGESTASETAPYDLAIHSNPDAQAWARFFVETMAKLGQPCPDEGTMLGWFANAMMAMHDFEASRSSPGERALRGAAASLLDFIDAELVFCWNCSQGADVAKDQRAAPLVAALRAAMRSPPSPGERERALEEALRRLGSLTNAAGCVIGTTGHVTSADAIDLLRREWSASDRFLESLASPSRTDGDATGKGGG